MSAFLNYIVNILRICLSRRTNKPRYYPYSTHCFCTKFYCFYFQI